MIFRAMKEICDQKNNIFINTCKLSVIFSPLENVIANLIGIIKNQTTVLQLLMKGRIPQKTQR